MKISYGRRRFFGKNERRDAAIKRLEEDELIRSELYRQAKRKWARQQELSATRTDSEAAVPLSRSVYDTSLAPTPPASQTPIYLTASIPEGRNIYLTGSIEMRPVGPPPCGSIVMPSEVYRSSDLTATERAVSHHGTAERNIYLSGSLGTATDKERTTISMVSPAELTAAANQLVTVVQAGGLTVRLGAGAVRGLLADVFALQNASFHESVECNLAEG